MSYASYIASSEVNDAVFQIELPKVKFGIGATEELGYEVKRLGLRRVLLVVGQKMVNLKPYEKVYNILKDNAEEVHVTTDVHIEPEDEALIEAFKKIKDLKIDGFIALGGGSTIDTAKVLNLLYTYGGDLMDYVNKPIGKGLTPPGPLKPLIAIPTTAGTGAENTAVAVLDIKKLRVKTGISNPYIRPTVAIIDPLNTITMPRMVTASTGLDVLNHAIESYTARPYTARERITNPAERPVYAGSTPIGDLFALKSIEWVNKYLRRAVATPYDIEARYYMAMAASLAGIGFGHAGVHVPHAMAYPIAGLVERWYPPDYEFGYSIVPHGISTALPAAYAFKYLTKYAPDRFLDVARVLGIDITDTRPKAIGEAIAEYYLELLSDLGIPTTLKEIGFTQSHLGKLVEGTLAQQRLLVLAPKQPITKEDLRTIFTEALG
ncbi:MAG: hydroxyacid-oxoacid transhydrogenase [Vulcanisaeta sp. AZ3]